MLRKEDRMRFDKYAALSKRKEEIEDTLAVLNYASISEDYGNHFQFDSRFGEKPILYLYRSEVTEILKKRLKEVEEEMSNL